MLGMALGSQKDVWEWHGGKKLFGYGLGVIKFVWEWPRGHKRGLVMEFMTGGSLRQQIGKLTGKIDKSVAIAIGVCRALVSAHEQKRQLVVPQRRYLMQQLKWQLTFWEPCLDAAFWLSELATWEQELREPSAALDHRALR